MNTAVPEFVWEDAAAAEATPAAPPGQLHAFRRVYGELEAHDRECWAELTRRAASSNIFVHDWFMDAALASCEKPGQGELLVVAADDGRWLGVLPIASEKRLGRWPVRTLSLWSATNQFLLTPLVLPRYSDVFWKTVLRHLDQKGGQGALYCRLLAANDAIDQALVARCRSEGRPLYLLDRYDRAAKLGIASDAPGKQVSKKSRRKLESRLRNLARRLVEEHGELEFSLHPDGRSPDVWIDAFLALERTGWKGRAGSAIACGDDTEALFRTAITRGCRMGMAHLATLKAGGRIIAMTSWFVTELQGYGFKMAYDEELSAFAPGQLLMQRVAELVDSQPELDFDTCSAPDSQNTKYLWPHRRELFDCVVGIGSPLRKLQLRLVMFLRSAWHRARAGKGGGE